MSNKVANPDLAVARIAGDQHGVISTAQLTEIGISRSAASRRVQRGRLHRIHQGVYAVGHRAPSWLGQWMAAVLACGEGAALSHLSAAHLWRLLKPHPGPIHVSVPSTSGRTKRRGLVIHRRSHLGPAAVTEERGIPVTTPAQTIADLDGTVAPARLRRAIRQAEVLGLRTGLEPSEATRSELEHLFLRLCERQRLQKPEVNVRVGPYEVDFLWRAERLVVETDGYKYHRGRQAFEDDHERDLGLRAAKFDVLHFTFRQITNEPEHVAALISRELRNGVRAGNSSAPRLPPRRS